MPSPKRARTVATTADADPLLVTGGSFTDGSFKTSFTLLGDGFSLSRARLELEPLAEPSDTPLERELRGIAAVLVTGEAEAGHDLAAHQLVFSIASQLEDAPA